MMKLNVKAFALSLGLLWGLAILLVGGVNLYWNSYALAFLQVLASIFPGYHAIASVKDLLVGVVYGSVCGMASGIAGASLYNLFGFSGERKR